MPSEIIYVFANELLLDIFENILNNAVKYNYNPSVEILIRISKVEKVNKQFIKMEFIDNGLGIHEDIKRLMFQERIIKEKGATGMGLGLSLVYKIMEMYNGYIWVEDKIKGDWSQGSNFIILIPEA